jgi:hypothetical protein
LIGPSRKHTRWLVALVLPGLLLRSLIPLGFMPMFGPGFSARIMLCAGYAPLPSILAHTPADMAMDMPMDGRAAHPDATEKAGAGGVPGHQEHSTCPFGASAALAAIPVMDNWSATAPAAVPFRLSQAQITHFELAPRAQSPRGPPV